MKKHHSDTFLHETDLASLNNRIASKVTFESFVTQNSIPSSPKTKDQSVMAQIDVKSQLDFPIAAPEPIENETKNGRISVPNEGTGSVTTGTNSAKSSIRELLQSQKSTSRRKSKYQNRARKALRTITFILGMSDIFSFQNLLLLLLQALLLFVGLPGISTPPYIHYANHANRIGSFLTRCFIVFIFSAISIRRSIHFVMH